MPLSLLPLPDPPPLRTERRLQLGPSGSAVAAMRQVIRDLALDLARHAARRINTLSDPEVAMTGQASIEGAEGTIDITITVARRR